MQHHTLIHMNKITHEVFFIRSLSPLAHIRLILFLLEFKKVQPSFVLKFKCDLKGVMRREETKKIKEKRAGEE